MSANQRNIGWGKVAWGLTALVVVWAVHAGFDQRALTFSQKSGEDTAVVETIHSRVVEAPLVKSPLVKSKNPTVAKHANPVQVIPVQVIKEHEPVLAAGAVTESDDATVMEEQFVALQAAPVESDAIVVDGAGVAQTNQPESVDGSRADPERPWLAEALNENPDSSYLHDQAEQHREQPRTSGWLKYESRLLARERNPLSYPTFKQMADAPHQDSQIVVKLRDHADAATSLADIGLAYESTLGTGLLIKGVHLYTVPVDMTMLEALETVNAHDAVAYAEPSYLVTQDMIPAVPDDPYTQPGTSTSYHWDIVNAYEAWDYATDARAIGPITLIDTGININHPDLKNNLWTNANEVTGNGVDDDNNGYVDDIHGINSIARNGSIGEGYPHGTSSSGLICAEGNNGIGVTGAAWDCELLMSRYDATEAGALSATVAGIEYGIANGSRLFLHEYGLTGNSQLLQDAFDVSEQHGVLHIIPAHNNGTNLDQDSGAFRYPQTYTNPNTIVVGASGRSDNRVSYSNYGSVSVDLASPTDLWTTKGGGSYALFNGTSAATPPVVGAVALLWSRALSWTPIQVKEHFLANVRPVGAWAGLTVTGGIMDMGAALRNQNLDTDGDGVLDDVDTDDDNDGVLDVNDAFPKDRTESVDTDGDGIGNNADTDDDGDGVNDADDWAPLDPREQYDTDNDGVGNNTDDDDDGDGTLDVNDAFPLNPNETTDSDGDGVGDNADQFPNDPNEDTDSDSDGVGDNGDVDADNDGIADDTENRSDKVIVDWTNASSGVTATGNNIAFNGAAGQWSSQINSVPMSRYGFTDNYRVSWTVDNVVSSDVMMGLGLSDSGPAYADIDRAFYIASTNALYNYENGNSGTQLGSVASGDRLSIEVGGGQLRYRRNGTVLLTRSVSGTPDYYVDMSYYQGGLRLNNFKVEPLSGVVNPDADSDGVNNQADLDSDNDTIADVIEVGLSDANGDYRVDNISDQGSITTPRDRDGDGVPDYLDIESTNAANDGTAYDIDSGRFAALDTNGDGMLSTLDTNGGNDSNGNGVDDQLENIGPGSVDLSIEDLTVVESVGVANVTLRLSRAATSAVTATVFSRSGSATGGQDFYGFTQAVTIAAGAMTTTVPVTIVDDSTRESAETLSVHVINVGGATLVDGVAEVTISDNDSGGGGTPTLSIVDTTINENVGRATVTLTLSQVASNAITALVFSRADGSATAGQDFYGFTQTVTIAAGSTSATVPVTIIDDVASESSETFSLRLINVTGADVGTGVATVTITDNDGGGTPATVSINSVTVNEGDGTATLTVSLSRAVDASVRVFTRAGSATGGSDYYGFTQLVDFTGGATERQIALTIIDDASAESTETLSLRLFDASGVQIDTAQGTVSIVDDD